MPAHDYYRWVRQHRDRIFSFAQYTLRHREDAEDVTQDVLIRLWKHRSTVDEKRLAAWLMKVTRNACMDALRRHKSRRSRIVEVGDDESLERATSERPDPQDQALTSDFHIQLEMSLRQLPESYRSIVVLREIQGMTYDEIAEVTGRPLSSVKVYLHRGRKMLRQAMRDRVPELTEPIAGQDEIAQASSQASTPLLISPANSPRTPRHDTERRHPTLLREVANA